MVPVWQKFILLVPLSGLNALTRLPLGVYRADPDLWALCEATLRETIAVGRAEGCTLPPDALDKGIALLRSMPPHHMTSMGNDLLRGNRLELPWFAGKVVELGRRHAIPTPANSFIYAALKLYAMASRVSFRTPSGAIPPRRRAGSPGAAGGSTRSGRASAR